MSEVPFRIHLWSPRVASAHRGFAQKSESAFTFWLFRTRTIDSRGLSLCGTFLCLPLLEVPKSALRWPVGHCSQEVNDQKTDMDLLPYVKGIMQIPTQIEMQTEVKLFLGLKKFHNHPQDVFHFHALFACFMPFWFYQKQKCQNILMMFLLMAPKGQVFNSQRHGRKRMQTFLRDWSPPSRSGHMIWPWPSCWSFSTLCFKFMEQPHLGSWSSL